MKNKIHIITILSVVSYSRETYFLKWKEISWFALFNKYPWFGWWKQGEWGGRGKKRNAYRIL